MGDRRARGRAWLKLVWGSAYTVNQVVLYDRPNSTEQITSATLNFSDGSSVAVGALNNNGTAVTVNFSARTVTSLTLTVTGATGGTSNIGLAEIQVYGSPAGGGNLPPTANAGPDKSANEGTAVTLSGSGSDSDGTIAGYAWTETAGPSVTLSGAATATASFTAPAVTANTVLTFQLTVTDNLGATGTDTVNVTVNDVSAGNLPPTANAGPDQTVNQGVLVQLNGTGSTDPEGLTLTYAVDPDRRTRRGAGERRHRHPELHRAGRDREHGAHLPAHRHRQPECHCHRSRQRHGADHPGQQQHRRRSRRSRRPRRTPAPASRPSRPSMA